MPRLSCMARSKVWKLRATSWQPAFQKTCGMKFEESNLHDLSRLKRPANSVFRITWFLQDRRDSVAFCCNRRNQLGILWAAKSLAVHRTKTFRSIFSYLETYFIFVILINLEYFLLCQTALYKLIFVPTDPSHLKHFFLFLYFSSTRRTGEFALEKMKILSLR